MPEAPLRVVVVDDHELVRAGVRGVLDGDPRFQVVAEAADGAQAVAAAEVHHPDVVVMDLEMPVMGGIEATRRIVAARPDTAILVLTMFDDDQSVYAAVRAGARGYLLKGAGRDAVRSATLAAAQGQAVFGTGVATKVLDALRPAPAAGAPLPQLTGREQQVLRLMADGHPTSAIARSLDISEKTVRNNVSSILTKLRVRDRAEAVEAAQRARVGTALTVARRSLLFTDIEGSTALLRRLGDAYRQLLGEHNRILDEATARHGGTLFGSAGDARFYWFTDEGDALASAAAARRNLAAHRFPEAVEVPVRMGVHAGEVTHHDGELIGLALHEAARVAAVARGGQIVVSGDARPDVLPPSLSFRDIGDHELRDVDRPLALALLEG